MSDDRLTPLRLSRIKRGLTQEQVAVRAGIATSTLRRLEGGGPLVRDIATKLARALDATPEERLAWLEDTVARREAGLFELIREFRRGLEVTEPEAAGPESTQAAGAGHGEPASVPADGANATPAAPGEGPHDVAATETPTGGNTP
jgi:transcriptional regulator with XRE-family HTH domain